MTPQNVHLLTHSKEEELEPCDIYYDEGTDSYDDGHDTYVNLHYKDRHIFICRTVHTDGSISYSLTERDLANKKEKDYSVTLETERDIPDDLLDVFGTMEPREEK